MGFPSGPKGVKKIVQQLFPEAFIRVERLGDARATLSVERKHVVNTLDGNVIMKAMVKKKCTMQHYVDNLYNTIVRALGDARVVVVVFDEPEILTRAKGRTHEKRDNATDAAAYSDDVAVPVPKTDDYDTAILDLLPTCEPLTRSKGRPARPRFYDEVVRRAACALEPHVVGLEGGGAVIFDGVDRRGGTRPAFAARALDDAFFAIGLESGEVAAVLRHARTGEGDVKLPLVEEQVRRVCALPPSERPELLRETTVHIASTVDTDGLAIGLLDAARRRDDRCDLKIGGFRSLVALIDNPKDAKKRKQDEIDGVHEPRMTLLCDFDTFYKKVTQKIFTIVHSDGSKEQIQADAATKRAAVSVLVLGWVLSGCDFAAIPTLHPLEVTQNAGAFVRRLIEQNELQRLSAAWTGDVHSLRLLVPPILHEFVGLCHRVRSETGARINHGKHVYDLDQEVCRAVWTLAYWCGHEHRESLLDFGFLVRPSATRHWHEQRSILARGRLLAVFFVFQIVRVWKRARTAASCQEIVSNWP